MTLNSLSNIEQIPIEETHLRVFLTEEQADFLTKKGVAIFEETISSKVFGTASRYYIEVDIHDLADVACK